MKQPVRKKRPQPTDLSASDVGRYLSRLASLNRDPKTGNPALGVALKELSDYLLASNASTVLNALPKADHGKEPEPEEFFDEASTLSKEEIISRLENDTTDRKQLVIIGAVRFGIPNSRLQKLSREDLTRALLSAIEHEQSIEILSDEAKIGGQKRES